jgi:hypothetical protein
LPLQSGAGLNGPQPGLNRLAETATAGFLFGKPIHIELGDHNAVADANETPADIVLISQKFEGPAWRLQTTKCRYALSRNGADD